MNIKKIKILFGFIVSISLFSVTILAADDTVTINVNVSLSGIIEVTPSSVSFSEVAPGVTSFPNSQGFTITNVGSTNFTQMYVSLDVWESGQEDSNPLGTGNPSNYYAGGFVVVKNETDLSGGNNWRFAGRQEWNLTEKPTDFSPDTWSVAWGYFGNNSEQYFWDLRNGTDGSCNQTGTLLRVKEWAVNGSATAYDLGSDAQTGSFGAASGEEWGINTFTAGPLNDYCIASHYSCERIFIYQWDQTANFPTCSDVWYLYNDQTTKFKPNDQFRFNMTVWIPKGVPAGDVSSSILRITAS
jgi:hypothetical protein